MTGEGRGLPLAPPLILVIASVGYCVYDIYRARSVRHLPKWAWALICGVSLPLGPLAYLMLGREPR